MSEVVGITINSASCSLSLARFHPSCRTCLDIVVTSAFSAAHPRKTTSGPRPLCHWAQTQIPYHGLTHPLGAGKGIADWLNAEESKWQGRRLGAALLGWLDMPGVLGSGHQRWSARHTSES